MSTQSYEIQGRTVRLPVEVRDARAAIATFAVPLRPAQQLVGEAFEVVPFLPGRTLLSLGCIDYRDNDLGDYDEVAINFFVRERGASTGAPYLGAWRGMAGGGLPSYTHRMPVNQSFTCEAGRSIWGFPKTLERIDFDESVEGSFGARLEMDGQEVFVLRAPRGGSKSRPPMDLESYSLIQGIPHRTRFSQRAEALGVSLGARGFELHLGPHPVAGELRTLGLPKRPLMTLWAGRLSMRFEAPEKL